MGTRKRQVEQPPGGFCLKLALLSNLQEVLADKEADARLGAGRVAGVEDAGNGGIVSFVILITEHRIQNPSS